MKKRKTIKAKPPRWRGATIASQKRDLEKLEAVAAEYKQAFSTAKEIDEQVGNASVEGFPVRMLAGIGLSMSPNRSDQSAGTMLLLRSLGDILPIMVKDRLK